MFNKKLDIEQTEEKIQGWRDVYKGIVCVVREGRRRREVGTKKVRGTKSGSFLGGKR